MLQRRWSLVEEAERDSTQFVFFNINSQKQNYFRLQLNAFGKDTLRGYWTLKDSLITLEVIRNSPLQEEIDSISLSSDSVGVRISLFKENAEMARISNGKIIEPDNFIDLSIAAISETQLVLHHGTENITFVYVPKSLSRPMSFASIARGILGMTALIVIGWLLSEKRKQINWKLVISGILLQLVFAVGVLKVPFIEHVFEGISAFFIKVISFTQEGTAFLFRNFDTKKIENPLINFVVMVLPTVIFFSALTSLLFYWGILQRIVYGLAWLMKKTMHLSGAESMAAAGNIFLGQTEAPLLVKPYLGNMTKSELMCLMTGGMATIAGGVLAAYIGFLGGDDPQEQLYFAKHLLAASVMSAPAAIVAAKLLVPETETINTEMTIPKDKIGSNALEAITNGTSDGLKLAANVAAMLLVFIAMIALGNWVMHDVIGELTGLNEVIRANTAYDGLSLQFIVGYTFAPIAYLLGVPHEDMVLVGQLLGEKTILNEFYAYTTLGEMKASGLFFSEKSIVMATYVLCGFANFASIGIQIGGIGSLAPNKKTQLSQLGFRALIGGTLACLFTAVVVGMMM